MPQNDSKHPVSPKLNRLQTPEQSAVRGFLRKAAPLIFGAGLLGIIVGMINFFMAFGGGGPPRLFWLFFVGMPLMFLGGVMSQYGFMGAAARYIAGETAPVATDTFNYVAEETQAAVQTVARSAAKGIVEGVAAGSSTLEDSFCPHCGFAIRPDYHFCPKCGKARSTDNNQA